jgi:predicted nucleic acid-binding protein
LKSKGILPDTCAWIDYFRAGANPLGRLLEEALSKEIVYACGPVLYELVQGARLENEQTTLVRALGALPFLEMTEELWVKAGKQSAALRKMGRTIPFSDVLIATLAIEHNLAVMTVDEHFCLIPGLVMKTT